MANDHYHFNGRHHGSSRHGKKHHTTTTHLPAVPYAQPSLLQSAKKSSTVRAVDPETMSAKQGLNEWGAFTGGGSTFSDSGTFGLGPLLLRQAVGDEVEDATSNVASSLPLTGRDLVEMDRLLRNDPVSFNPMQAISWARLDDDVMEEAPPQTQKGVPKATGNGKAVLSRDSGRRAEYQQGASSASASRTIHQSGLDDRTANNMATTATGGPLSMSASRDVYLRGSEAKEPTQSPVGTMAQTFSNMDMVGSDQYGDVVPPVAVSPSITTHRAEPAHPQVRQQRKNRRRHEKVAASSPAEAYKQQEISHPWWPFTTLSTSGSVPAQSYPAQHQSAYVDCSTSNQPLQPPHVSPPQKGIGLLLCLAPSCQARFPSEAQLNAHYQAIHVASQPIHSGRQQPYSSSESLTCSWTLCGAGGFTSQNALVWHVKAEHLLLCPVPGCCDRVFPSRKQVDGHVRNPVGQ